MDTIIAGFFKTSHKHINFEDLQYAIQHVDDFIIINTLSIGEQDCLIFGTLPFNKEEEIINHLLQNYDYSSKKFIIYGKNNNDAGCEKKAKQLVSLGFSNVFIYVGGLFEWLLLQDIYGNDEFPTTKKILDILKYKPIRQIC
uniref:Rhodanese domain-containing protein n=1 Tax=viral metagenome TaxID=1070528 RepID=A0A6C0DS27_9ZZZZ